METKKLKLQKLIEGGEWEAAINVARYFRRDFDSEEQRVLGIVGECNATPSREAFYVQLGNELPVLRAQAHVILKKWYNRTLPAKNS